ELRSQSGDSYLKYWCDSSAEANRWIVARISQVSIIKLMARKRALRDVLTDGVQDPFVYIVDVFSNEKIMTRISPTVPEEYLPLKDALLPPPAIDPSLGYQILLVAQWHEDQF